MVAYPHKDHTLAREVDISLYMGDMCWFSCGRYNDLVADTKGFWLCRASPVGDDNDMEMKIVMFSHLEDAIAAMQAVEVVHSNDVISSYAFLTGVNNNDLRAQLEGKGN